MNRQPLVIADADNTLWDTDAVYATAQLQLLRDVEDAIGSRSEKLPLTYLRDIDQQIAVAHSMHLRYPPEILVAALVSSIAGGSISIAIRQSLEGWRPKQVKSHELAARFLDTVKNELPKLRKGVCRGLLQMNASGIYPIILTEGSKDRCLKILRAHNLEKCVLEVVEGRKSPSVYENLRGSLAHGSILSFMIGDQADCDIDFARKAGYITIYYPSTFVPIWSKGNFFSADYQISDFAESTPLIIQHLQASA